MKNRINPKLNNIVDNNKLKFIFIQLLIVITLIMSILMSLFIQYNGLDGEGIKNAYIISFIYIFEVEFNLISILTMCFSLLYLLVPVIIIIKYILIYNNLFKNLYHIEFSLLYSVIYFSIINSFILKVPNIKLAANILILIWFIMVMISIIITYSIKKKIK
jgi:hypothetical protein